MNQAMHCTHNGRITIQGGSHGLHKCACKIEAISLLGRDGYLWDRMTLCKIKLYNELEIGGIYGMTHTRYIHIYIHRSQETPFHERGTHSGSPQLHGVFYNHMNPLFFTRRPVNGNRNVTVSLSSPLCSLSFSACVLSHLCVLIVTSIPPDVENNTLPQPCTACRC